MWKNWHILGSSAHARTSRSVKYLGRPDNKSQFAFIRATISLIRDQGLEESRISGKTGPGAGAGHHRCSMRNHCKGIRITDTGFTL